MQYMQMQTVWGMCSREIKYENYCLGLRSFNQRRTEEIYVLKQQETNGWHSLQPENVTPSWRGAHMQATQNQQAVKVMVQIQPSLVNKEKVQYKYW